MIKTLLVGGLSGILCVTYLYGLAIKIKIVNDHRDHHMRWIESFRNNVHGFRNWFLFLFASLINGIILLGIGASVFLGD